MDATNWYLELIKPAWAPPSWIFGPVWSFLYVLIFISFGSVFWMAWKKKISVVVVLPFVANLVFNLSFVPLQFGLRNNFLAAINIVLVLITIIYAMISIYPRARWIAYVQIPYLLWVLFATALQFVITYLNG